LRAANLINILRLRLDADKLKKDLDSVYQKLVALLQEDLQLSLFEDGVEFGGAPHEVRGYTANYLSNISASYPLFFSLFIPSSGWASLLLL
jgi:ABC-type cobalt transport system substrate-binding protein